jgi:hypothetical protein
MGSAGVGADSASVQVGLLRCGIFTEQPSIVTLGKMPKGRPTRVAVRERFDARRELCHTRKVPSGRMYAQLKREQGVEHLSGIGLQSQELGLLAAALRSLEVPLHQVRHLANVHGVDALQWVRVQVIHPANRRLHAQSGFVHTEGVCDGATNRSHDLLIAARDLPEAFEHFEPKLIAPLHASVKAGFDQGHRVLPDRSYQRRQRREWLEQLWQAESQTHIEAARGFSDRQRHEFHEQTDGLVWRVDALTLG